MEGHGAFLLGAGAILGALALAGLGFGRMGQSVVPAFILLGMALRPLAVDRHMVEVLATVGVVLLLFFMGLEFSLGALLSQRRRIVRNGALDLLVCFPPGVVAGLVMGWGLTGGLLLGGAMYATSSAIVAKGVIEHRRSANPETEVALGVLVFEDLFVALLLALLSGAVVAAEPSPLATAWGVGKALLFFGAVLLVATRARALLDRLFDLENDDLFLLLVGSVVLLLSWAALAAGLSEAIGAFLAGLALAETRHRHRAQELLSPLQGIFAALFFLAFGLSVDPAAFGGVWPLALVLVVVAVATKVWAGWRIGQRDGLPKRSSLALGMTLVPRGEFSIVLGGIATAAGQPRLAALVALLVLCLSLLGAVSMRFAPEVAQRAFPRRAPRTLEDRGFRPELAAHDVARPAADAPTKEGSGTS